MPARIDRKITPVLHRYIHGPMRRIEGWFTELDAEMTVAIAEAQNAAQISGSVGEIGVHHGRAFVALALALKGGERAFAVDVFSDQHRNEDRSGRGDEAVFRRNLARHGVAADRVCVLQASSLDIRWSEIEAAVGEKARLFSIDGGHTAPVVQNDLDIAHAGLCDAGVVIADDYFDSGYPGVSEGVARFMLANPDALHPFAIGDSRLFLCRPAWVEHYRDVLAASPAAGSVSLNAAMWGATVTVYRTRRTLLERARAWPVVQVALRRGWGRRLKPAIRRMLASD